MKQKACLVMPEPGRLASRKRETRRVIISRSKNAASEKFSLFIQFGRVVDELPRWLIFTPSFHAQHSGWDEEEIPFSRQELVEGPASAPPPNLDNKLATSSFVLTDSISMSSITPAEQTMARAEQKMVCDGWVKAARTFFSRWDCWGFKVKREKSIHLT